MDDASQIATLLRWWMVIGLSAVAGALAGLGTSTFLPDTYEASATMLVGGVDASDLAYDELLAAQSEAQTYAVLATFSSILQETIVRTGLPMTPAALQEVVSVEAPSSRRFVSITVTASSPWAAADTANAIAATLLIEPPSEEDRARLQALERQITDLSAEASDIEERIDRLRQPASSPTTDTSIQQLEGDLEELELARRVLLDQITELSNNSLILVDPASRPVAPSAPRPMFNAAVAAVVSGVLAAGVALTFGRRPRQTAKS